MEPRGRSDRQFRQGPLIHTLRPFPPRTWVSHLGGFRAFAYTPANGRVARFADLLGATPRKLNRRDRDPIPTQIVFMRGVWYTGNRDAKEGHREAAMDIATGSRKSPAPLTSLLSRCGALPCGTAR